MSRFIRPFLSILLGNVLGLSAWSLAGRIIPALWEQVTPEVGFVTRGGLIALTFILLAAPPVLIGALGAWLAKAGELWVGLACGVWGVVLIQTVPLEFPIAQGIWYAPTVLVLLSSALGGWMLDLRAQAEALKQ